MPVRRTLPAALLLAQVRRGDVLPASILLVYVLAGAAIYVFYGQRRARRRLQEPMA